jgi:hypothetical protein
MNTVFSRAFLPDIIESYGITEEQYRKYRPILRELDETTIENIKGNYQMISEDEWQIIETAFHSYSDNLRKRREDFYARSAETLEKLKAKDKEKETEKKEEKTPEK